MLRHSNLLITTALLLAIASATRADPIDDFLQGELQQHKIPGLAVAVVKEGKLIKAGGYGLANVEHNVPVKPETVFKIGSVSKQFIATGVVLLAAEGKLSLDDKIAKYLDGCRIGPLAGKG